MKHYQKNKGCICLQFYSILNSWLTIFFVFTGLFCQAQDMASVKLKNIDTLSICSFNIQFLGHFKAREDSLLANVLETFDIVVIQEMVAPPIEGVFPDGSPFRKDNESALFTKQMTKRGFKYWLSSEDTGPSKNHVNSTSSEWWITFYKPEMVNPDSSKFYGFIDTVVVGSVKYRRVPYSMPFMSTKDGTHLFSLISLHLHPGNGNQDREIRANELAHLFNWTKNNEDSTQIILLGDCNIYDSAEFISYDTIGIYSLNKDCLNTNTKLYESHNKGKPYDHVFYSSKSTQNMITTSFKVIDLMDYLKNSLPPEQFIYEPYEHDLFRTSFSDHLPIKFDFIVKEKIR